MVAVVGVTGTHLLQFSMFEYILNFNSEKIIDEWTTMTTTQCDLLLLRDRAGSLNITLVMALEVSLTQVPLMCVVLPAQLR